MTGLLRHRDFAVLLVGQSISQLGTAVTYVALPAVAVIVLHANAAEVGMLEVAQFAGWPLLGFFVGSIVDRVPRRQILLYADAVRFVVLSGIPLLHWTGHLDFAILVAVAGITGAATVVFEVAYYTYIPAVVAPNELLDANAKLMVMSSGAEVSGPMLGGALIVLLGAATAITADVASYAVSLISVALLHEKDAPLKPANQRSRRLLFEAVAGMRVVWSDPVLRSIALATAAGTLGSSIVSVMYFIFAYRDLHLSPALLGVALGGGNAALLVGSALAPRISRRFGYRVSMPLSFTVANAGMSVCCLATVVPAALAFTSGAIVVGIALPIFNVAQYTLRQARSPRTHLARVNATITTIARSMRPVGAGIGGLLGSISGSITTIVAGTAVGATGVVALGWTLRPSRLAHDPLRHPDEDVAHTTRQM